MSLEETMSQLGYKSPPEWSRYKKGRSGNPKGRPKKKSSLGDMPAINGVKPTYLGACKPHAGLVTF